MPNVNTKILEALLKNESIEELIAYTAITSDFRIFQTIISIKIGFSI